MAFTYDPRLGVAFDPDSGATVRPLAFGSDALHYYPRRFTQGDLHVDFEIFGKSIKGVDKSGEPIWHDVACYITEPALRGAFISVIAGWKSTFDLTDEERAACNLFLEAQKGWLTARMHGIRPAPPPAQMVLPPRIEAAYSKFWGLLKEGMQVLETEGGALLKREPNYKVVFVKQYDEIPSDRSAQQ